MLSSLKALYNRFVQGWSDFKALATKDFKVLWNEYRTVFILLGALLVTLKFKDWLVDFLINGSKKMFQKAQAQNLTLQTKEDSDNKQADALINQAAQLPSQEVAVNDDWNKSK